jgi:L-lactate dehydrogenase complex protein LldG
MKDDSEMNKFIETARKVGAEVLYLAGIAPAVDYIRELAGGPVLVPAFAGGERLELARLLGEAGCTVVQEDFRKAAPNAAAGVTGANFALADTGSVALESTDEAIRLATTLPERHFVLLDPRKILPDGLAAAPVLRKFHQLRDRNFLAYITGPSRTADIERVLTIGVHGPRELHILLVEGISDDFLEM